MTAMAKRLAANGYVAATVSYRLTPMSQFPLPLHDGKSAVRFLRANAAKYDLDGAHLGAIGVSAGATWAQFLAVSPGVAALEGGQVSSAVDCAVSYYDMRRAYEGSRNAALDTQFRASPLAWLNPDSARCWRFTGRGTGMCHLNGR
jgi:acetyl esterase/lipase